MKNFFLTCGFLSFFFLFSCTNLNDEKLFSKATDFWSRGKYEEAVQNFITLTKSYPSSPLVEDSLFWIAAIYDYYLDDPERAIRYYRVFGKNLQDSRYYKDAMRNLAKIYKSMNNENKERAILIYQRLQSESVPEEWQRYQYQIIETYVATEQYEQARIEMKKFIEKAPNSPFAPNVFSMIGFTYYITGQYELAKKSFLEMKERYPDQISADINLLDIYQETGDLKRALKTLQSLPSEAVEKAHLNALIDQEIKTLKFRISKLR